MTISECISATYLKATGKPTLSATSSKYTRIVKLLDFYQRRWAREPGIDWHSLYNPAFPLGTISNTDTYDLDASSIRKLSDYDGDAVRVMWTDGESYSDYEIVSADSLKLYFTGQNKENPIGYYCAQIGNELVFNHKFISTDSQYGGALQVPVYTFPDAIDSTNPTVDEVQVDDPDWLVARVAAEYVRNDITRQQHYPELIQEANEIMQRMKDDNDFQVDVVDRPWTPFSGLSGNFPWGS